MKPSKFWIPGSFLFFAGLFLFLLIPQANAASAKFTPTLELGYHWNNNIMATDPDQIDSISVQWADYLVGLNGMVKSKNITLSLGGDAGYSQAVSSTKDLERLVKNSVSNLSYLNADLIAGFDYTNPRLEFSLTDAFKRNRTFSDIFGIQNSDFSNFYLYDDNVATATLKWRMGAHFDALAQYSYWVTMFEKPQGDITTHYGNSYQQSGEFKLMYKINPKVSAGLDLQGGERVYAENTQRDTLGNEIKQKVSSYTYLQELAEVDFAFDPRTSLIVAAGANQRQFFNQGDFKLKDEDYPVARINFIRAVKNQYDLTLSGECGSNTYGLNEYFTYYQAGVLFDYYIRKQLHLTADVIYKNDTFSRSSLDLEEIWAKNRVDGIIIAEGGFTWDMLRKQDVPYLSLSAKYEYLDRNSNIDGKDNDYEPGYGGLHYSYNTTVQSAFVQLIFNPSILIGPR